MELEQVANAIKSMEIRGAGRIARSAAEAIKQQALSYSGNEVEELIERLQEGERILIASRPTAVSLENAVRASLKGIQEVNDVREMKDLVASNADAFIRRSSNAVQIIGEIGARRIRAGQKVMTHCNSSAALSVIKTAHFQGKKIEVVATESRPWRQGLLTVRDLAAANVPVTLIVDSAVRWAMKDVDVVVAGADTICSNGAVINKIGTSQLALAAHEANVPFVICAETYKFSPRTVYGELVEIEERDPSEIARAEELPSSVKIRNPVFDATPPEYIDSIVTEVGVISPYAAYEVIVKEFGLEHIFE